MPFLAKYKKEYPALYIEMSRKGKTICHFCADLEIARQTFYDWINKHPEFAHAAKIGKNCSEAWLTDVGIAGATGEIDGFSATAWSMLMRNRSNFTQDRKIQIDFTTCKTSKEKQSLVDLHVAQGRLSMTEAKHMGEYIATSVKVEENTELKRRLEALEDSV